MDEEDNRNWISEMREEDMEWDTHKCPKCGCTMWFPLGHPVSPLDYCDGCEYEFEYLDSQLDD